MVEPDGNLDCTCQSFNFCWLGQVLVIAVAQLPSVVRAPTTLGAIGQQGAGMQPPKRQADGTLESRDRRWN